LTANVPAAKTASPGTAAITVVSPGPGGGTSNPQFFQVGNLEPQLYFTIKDVTGNANITSNIAAADFNVDGKLDLIGASGSILYAILGNADGTFGGVIPSYGPTNSNITGISVADVNADGIPDLIVTGSINSSTAFVATMLGNGDGTFKAPIETDFPGVQLPSQLVFADFNGDGALDFAYASGMNVQTILGHGDGTFCMGPTSPVGEIALNAVAAGDFNRDGKLDLVVTAYDIFSTGFDFVVVMPGVGDGSFDAPTAVSGSGTNFVGSITAAVADFNGDGKLDIATAIQTVGATLQGIIQVSLGNGDGTFQAASYVPDVVEVTTPLIVGDFDGDGFLDLNTGGFVFFGRGDGTFPSFQGSTGNPTAVLVGDFNGDGKLDVVDEALTLNGSSVLTAVGMFLSIPPTPDFTGVVAPLNTTLVPGGSVSINVTLKPLYGFTGDVVISATDLPNGVTPSYNPIVVPGGNGGSTITLTAASSVALGRYTVTLNGNSGNITHSSTVPLLVNNTVGDWGSYTVQPVQNVAPGGTATYAIVTIPEGGFNGTIIPTISGLPPGATATFSPASIDGAVNANTQLTIQTSNITPQPQVYTLTVTGTEGTLSHSGPVYLGVSSSGGDFIGTISPTSASTKAGGSAAFQLSSSPVNGGAGDVALSVSNLPAGITASFTPSATISGGSGTSTLTLGTSIGTLPGTYYVIVTSTGSGVIHMGSLQLTVTP
jgi:hypothetical protein